MQESPYWNPILTKKPNILWQYFIFVKFKVDIRDQRNILHRMAYLFQEKETNMFWLIHEGGLRFEKID